MPLRDLVPFPGATIPFFAGRARTLQALDLASQRQREVVIAIQKTSAMDEPGLADVYDIGVLAGVLDLIHLGDGTVKVLTQIYRRVAIRGFVSEASGYLADIENISAGPIPDAPDLIRTAIAHFTTYAERHTIRLPQALQPWLLGQVREPDLVADIVVRQIRDPAGSPTSSPAISSCRSRTSRPCSQRSIRWRGSSRSMPSCWPIRKPVE